MFFFFFLNTRNYTFTPPFTLLLIKCQFSLKLSHQPNLWDSSGPQGELLQVSLWLVDAYTPISLSYHIYVTVFQRQQIVFLLLRYFVTWVTVIWKELTAYKGKDIRILSYLAPGVYKPNLVPLSYIRLNSTYLPRLNNCHSLSTLV